jgi:hypothetical protein
VDGIATDCGLAQAILNLGGGLDVADLPPGLSPGTTQVNGKDYTLVAGVDGWIWLGPNGEELDQGNLAELGLGDPGSGLPTDRGKPQQQSDTCSAKILSAINKHFGKNFTSADVGTGPVYGPFPWPQVPGGTINIDVFPGQDQAGGISPGRYAVNWWTYVIGYGSTLHIPAGPGGLDSPATLAFSSSQFTAHLDSAFPYNPIGALFHLLIDVKGIGGHQPCP